MQTKNLCTIQTKYLCTLSTKYPFKLQTNISSHTSNKVRPHTPRKICARNKKLKSTVSTRTCKGLEPAPTNMFVEIEGVGANISCLQCAKLFCLHCGRFFFWCVWWHFVCSVGIYFVCSVLDFFSSQSGIVFYVKSSNLCCLQCILFWERSNSL